MRRHRTAQVFVGNALAGAGVVLLSAAVATAQTAGSPAAGPRRAAARTAAPHAASNGAALIDAVKRDDRRAVRALLLQHADVNAAEADGTTALHWASRSDDVELVRLLVRAGARAAAANRYGVTPLSLAAQNGNANVISLLIKAGADPNATGPDGQTTLMLASRSGHVDAVKTLLAHGVDVNAAEAWYGQTALIWAAAEGHLAVVRALAENGANVHARTIAQEGFPKWREGKDYRSDKDGNSLQPLRSTFPRGGLTALLYAARQGHVEVASALVDAGASPDEQDPDGLSAITVAIVNGHYDVAARLLDKGANPNLADTWGRAPLFAAVDMHTLAFMPNRPRPKTSETPDTIGMIKLLLDKGANPNARLTASPPARLLDGGPIDGGDDLVLNAGATPLTRAAVAADLEVMRILIDRGADPSLTNKFGSDCVMVAVGPTRWWADPAWDDSEPKRREAIALLVDRAHASLAAHDATGQTALHMAALLGSEQIVRYLVGQGASLQARNEKGRTPLEEVQQAPRKDRGRSLLAAKPQTDGPQQAAIPTSMVTLLQELMAKAGTPSAAVQPH
jgi:ankyrin repeat protein